MTQIIKKLPAIFQTVTEKKFFDATFDQLFSKKDSDILYGYLGRRDPGHYNPLADFYLPEPSKNRTWWQLEATAFARNANSAKENVFFYDDLLDRINYYGGNTLNQDRLFESEYYSWAPPIDFDMFLNYQSYYWVYQGLPTIIITGTLGESIVGAPSYTTSELVTPAGLTLTTGMSINLIDDPLYQGVYVVENVGNCEGIRLIPPAPDFTAGATLEFLPWDGSIITPGDNRVIANTNWDILAWETQPQASPPDYITIERGSKDRNSWSRTNRWYHIDAINATYAVTGIGLPTSAIRALRPIIQFVVDLMLYNAGTQFKSDISYGFKDNAINEPLLLSQFQGQSVSYINSELSIDIQNFDLVVFMSDLTTSYAPPAPVNAFIYQAIITAGIVIFVPYGTRVAEGDIVFVLADSPYNGALRGQTFYFENSAWVEATNEKDKANQPPLFQLYDHNYIPLDDVVTYPLSNFAGSKIFSYKENSTPGATVDPVLKFPIVYTSLGQSSDIIFQNNLITDRYTYSNTKSHIDGYYYYNGIANTVLYNNWNLFSPCPCGTGANFQGECLTVSKQRVIDKFVVGYGSQYQFKLSVVPLAIEDIIVSVNGEEVKPVSISVPSGYSIATINNSIYVVLTTYIETLLLTPQTQPPVVEIQTYTQGLLDPAAPGYFEIPQQLEANPTQLEISDISASNLILQFESIIKSQRNFEGIAFGGNNNFRDSLKNRSLGNSILQNVAPALKSMLVASSTDLDVIAAIRFSQDEYTKFKNKYLKTALQLINREFSPVQYHNNTIVISAWVEEILKTVNISKEFSNAFAYSYMIANSGPYVSENHVVPVSASINLDNYIDLDNPRNALYIYDISGQERLLISGVDYYPLSVNNVTSVQFNVQSVPVNTPVYCALYSNSTPAYIPSTPTKVGAYNAFVPRIELDTTYTIPTNVIIGHDGSKTVAFNDYRDQLLLELEKRIYNLLHDRYVYQYSAPLRIESVKSGKYRETRYSREEYLDVTESYMNKWSAKNRANYRVNEWDTFNPITPVDKLWKLYNYAKAQSSTYGWDTDEWSGNVEEWDWGNIITPLNLPAHWKGIFQYYYDTYNPDTKPWEMLGFSEQPSWWQFEYGAPVLNLAGQEVWTKDAIGPISRHVMYKDIKAGIIRQGPSAMYDPVTLKVQPNPLWIRSLTMPIPVDAAGEIIPVPELFDIIMSGDPYNPFDGYDDPWVYGDGAPVEQAWMSTSGYAFSVQEILYLMKPGPYGELMWDTLGTIRSPGQFYPGILPSDVPGGDPYEIEGPVLSSINWQYVQSGENINSDPFYHWVRLKNKDQVVHAETVDGVIQLRFGYQNWISDRILFLGKDITTVFGQKIRTLDVNLANKLAGFTNKDTMSTYIESITPGSTTTSLLIPTNNFDVFLHKGQPIKTYTYSGVIIRALENGMFTVYGYDLLNSSFITLDRSNAQLIDVTIGGTPASFKIYNSGETYYQGDIVRYNGVYYVSKGTLVAGKFNIDNWVKLKALPTINGISVSYKPISENTTTKVAYGTTFNHVQEVFDFLIGWGAYLESQGWKFDEVSQDTNQISDWLYSAKQFLFWINTSWAPNSSIQLSPAANKASLIVNNGYPDDVETISNGIYSVLDKFGVAISANNTTTDRDGSAISVSPTTMAAGGIYFLQVNASETEHILIFDNTTSFNDILYDPLLRIRQQRLRFNGFRSNGWFGKMEAPGYLIIGDQITPNFDSIVDAMRYYYDPDVTIDNPSLEDLGRHLIGFESKSYLDNLQVTNDIQYLFYQGAIRQKGTIQSFDKLFRSTKIQNTEAIQVYEEWALKLHDFGNTIEQVSTEFILQPEQHSGEVIVARLNFVPSTLGHIKQINILNAENVYVNVPKIVISLPDAAPAGWVLFSETEAYIIGSIVRYDNALGNPVYYSSTAIQGPSAFNPANWTVVLETLRARAYAVLNTDGIISRVDMTDPGYGYLTPATIDIDSGLESHELDKCYSIWQGDIIRDESKDNIIEIDIDDTALWTVRPPDPEITLEFPTTSVIEYSVPNAGYVNFSDVTWSSFNVIQTVVNWGTSLFNPSESDTVWIAKTFTEDWNVYKMVNLSPPLEPTKPWKVVADSSDNLLLLTDYNVASTLYVYSPPQGPTTPGGTGAVLEPVIDNEGKITSVNIISGGTGYVITDIVIPMRAITPLVECVDATFTITVDMSGTIDTIAVVEDGNGYQPRSLEIVPDYATSYGEKTNFGNVICLQIKKKNVVDPETNYAVAFVPNGIYTDPDSLVNYNSYSLVTLDGIPITATDISAYAEFTDLLLFKTMRWTSTPTEPLLPAYVGLNDLIWVDNISNKWSVIRIQADPGAWNTLDWDVEISDYWEVPVPVSTAVPIDAYGWDVAGPMYFSPYRVQENLIDTSLFESAQVFHSRTQNELVLLPIYDPFKQIFPGVAKQNITYMSMQDPAKYNVTDNPRLFSDNLAFNNNQVGRLWWDLSDVRYVYYEQPIALDGSETATENIVYRRDHWGQIFPGSSVSIYEWTESNVPPAEYTGSGTPRSLVDYVQISTIDKFTSVIYTKYYFWVLNSTDKPNIENRTLAGIDVARLLEAPKSQGYSFFAPIQQTSNNNSYMFYNVQEILNYQGNNIQIQYRISQRDDQVHAQWAFFREGDPNSTVTDQFWNKMVDSLCGYTKILPPSPEWGNGIFIAGNLPWDIGGWDIAPYDATTITASYYGVILPVPDPRLSEAEKYGITYRPRQGMFTNILSARKIFVQAGNKLLSQIPIRDNNPSWVVGVTTDTYWEYTDWYATGYENAVPTLVFNTLTEANDALIAGEIANGTIVEVINGIGNLGEERFVLYEVVQLDPSIEVQNFQLVAIEASAIKLLDTIYTAVNLYGLSAELRQLLNALRTKIFVNEYIVNQNQLYFSMLNYVLSEQKTPNWLFKSSYIYIRENNLPLLRDNLFLADQSDDIVKYIADVKPYHTQIRDYTRSYSTSDLINGSVVSTMQSVTTLEFKPGTDGSQTPWDYNSWYTDVWDQGVEYSYINYVLDAGTLDVNLDQFVSMENVYTVDLTFFDSSKIGYSQLFPYTFDFTGINLNNPQTFITPNNIVAIKVGDAVMYYGNDYYVEYNDDTTYTAYLFVNPGANDIVAYVYTDSGRMVNLPFDSYKNELAVGIPYEDFVVNVDTLLPVNNVSGVLYPYAPWGDTVSDVDPIVAAIIVNAGGVGTFIPGQPQNLQYLSSSVSYKQNVRVDSINIYRNAEAYKGELIVDLPAPAIETEHNDVITVYVSPLTHLITDILPNPGVNPGVIWIGGERIEYSQKSSVALNTWELRLVRRGTQGTAPTAHDAMIPSLANPLVLVPNPVWVEASNSMPAGSEEVIWNAADGNVDPATVVGGIWYANTAQSQFLKEGQGVAIP